MGDPYRTVLSAGFNYAPLGFASDLAYQPEVRFYSFEFRAPIPAAKRHREYDEVTLLPEYSIIGLGERRERVIARLSTSKFQDASPFLTRSVHAVCLSRCRLGYTPFSKFYLTIWCLVGRRAVQKSLENVNFCTGCTGSAAKPTVGTRLVICRSARGSSTNL